MRNFALLLVSLLFAACTPPSLNIQRASLRAGGDVSATVYLDTVDKAKVAAQQKLIKDTCEAIDNFMATGNVAELPLAEVGRRLKQVIPAPHRRWIDSALAVASAAETGIDLSKAIGADNVARIRAFLIGGITGATEYNIAHRTPDPSVTSAPDPGSGTAAAGGGTE